MDGDGEDGDEEREGEGVRFQREGGREIEGKRGVIAVGIRIRIERKEGHGREVCVR